MDGAYLDQTEVPSLSLLVGDIIRWNGAGVTGPNAADVGQREEAGDAHQTHTGAVQVHLSEMYVFQVLQT